MSREETPARIVTRLRGKPWVTASELAKELHLSAGTVRGHLDNLAVEGVVERRVDEGTPGYAGRGTTRYRVRDEALPPAEKTSDLLCDTCAVRDYGDVKRYGRLLVRDESREPNPDDEAAYDEYLATVTCDRCGRLLYP